MAIICTYSCTKSMLASWSGQASSSAPAWKSGYRVRFTRNPQPYLGGQFYSFF